MKGFVITTVKKAQVNESNNFENWSFQILILNNSRTGQRIDI